MGAQEYLGKIESINVDSVLWQRFFDALDLHRDSILKNNTKELKNFEKRYEDLDSKLAFSTDWHSLSTNQAPRSTRFSGRDEEMMANHLKELKEDISRIKQASILIEKGTKKEWEKFVLEQEKEVFSNGLDLEFEKAPLSWILFGERYGRPNQLPQDLRHVLPSPLEISQRTLRDIQNHLGRLVSIGPYRKQAERTYVHTGKRSSYVGPSGDLMPDILYKNRKMVDVINEWFRKLEIPYDIKVPTLKSDYGVYAIRLISRQGTDVNLTDVGFGISQILPLIVQIFLGVNQIITIEQPELHLHPRLQAELGELFAVGIKERGHQFIIETHSEHLLLRIQKLVRDGKVSNDEISVNYVLPLEGESEVQNIGIDSKGALVDNWPGGFFPERLREFL